MWNVDRRVGSAICRNGTTAGVGPQVFCESRDTEECPCPLDYLHVLAVQAIDEVDRERQQRPSPVTG